MQRPLISGIALAALALAAACGGGGGGGHAAVPPAPAGSGGTANGSVVLTIPNPTTAGTARKPQFVSSGATAAQISGLGTTQTFDVSSTSSLCTTVSGGRQCTLGVTATSGTYNYVVVTLYDTTGGVLGSASGSVTVNAPQSFSLSIDIDPLVATVALQALAFPNNLTTFVYRVASSGTLSLTYKDAAGVTITPTNTSTFQSSVHLHSSDAHVLFTSSNSQDLTVTNAAQSIGLTYDGSALVNTTVTITAQIGTFTQTSLSTLNALGFLQETALTNGTAAGPSGITVGPDSNLWFTELGASKIARVTFPSPYTGTPSFTEYPVPTSSSGPYSIAAGTNGDTDLYFSESLGYNIGYIDSAAASPAPIESSGPADQLGVASLNGYIYLADTANHEIHQFSETSKTITSSASLGSCHTQQIAIGSDGNIWVTCGSHPYLYYISPSNLSSTPAVHVTASYSSATGIAAGPDDAIWYCDSGLGLIGRISTDPSNTHALTQYTVPSGAAAMPTGIAKGPDGAMWFTEPGVGKIGRLDPAHPASMIEIQTQTTTDQPRFITAGPDGWMWFTEYQTGFIGRMMVSS